MCSVFTAFKKCDIKKKCSTCCIFPSSQQTLCKTININGTAKHRHVHYRSMLVWTSPLFKPETKLGGQEGHLPRALHWEGHCWHEQWQWYNFSCQPGAGSKEERAKGSEDWVLSPRYSLPGQSFWTCRRRNCKHTTQEEVAWGFLSPSQGQDKGGGTH